MSFRKKFSAHTTSISSSEMVKVWEKLTQRFISGQTFIRCYYCGLFFMAVPYLRRWPDLLETTAFDTLWPVYWLNWLPEGSVRIAVGGILFLFLFGTMLGAISPGYRWARLVAFLGIFLAQALQNSYGKISHSYHLWHLSAFLLIFLPHGWNAIASGVSRMTKLQTLQTIWYTLAFILMTYSMSGLGKIVCALYQLALGEVSAFHPLSMSIHVATRLLETNTETQLGAFLIEIGPWSWPLLISATYLQFVSLVIAFRPCLLKAWGLGLVLFHLSVWFTFKISFFPACLILALFMFAGPFGQDCYTIKERLLCLPGIGLFKFLGKK
ncbi:MAG: hypothetical protein AAGA18_07455 [Verrucomicrobiota bacterium]